jgi:hypothetical protein
VTVAHELTAGVSDAVIVTYHTDKQARCRLGMSLGGLFVSLWALVLAPRHAALPSTVAYAAVITDLVEQCLQ